MEQEGVIKYNMNWNQSGKAPDYDISSLIHFRNKCFNCAWIGYDTNNQVGYGNISLRYKKHKQFFISGSQTGHIPSLEANQFSFIKKYNVVENSLECIGPVKASSESLTHAAIFELSDRIDAIIHIHNKELWEKHKDVLPTTNHQVAYGTPEMASEVHRLFQSNTVHENGLLIMGGHEDGIIAWGMNFETAFDLLKGLE